MFNAFFLCFSCVGIFRACCGRFTKCGRITGGDIIPWLRLIVFLPWYLGICVWGDYQSRCWFQGLSLLDVHFVPLLLLPLWISRGWDSCVACFAGLLGWCVHKRCLPVLEVGIQQWVYVYVRSEEVRTEHSMGFTGNMKGGKGGSRWCSVAELKRGPEGLGLLGEQEAEE